MWLDDVPGEHNPADIFTKGVEPSRQFRKLRDIVMGADPNLNSIPRVPTRRGGGA